jgi:hypothetical protein
MPYAAGTCRGCGGETDGSRCEACKAERREQEAALRNDRRARGLCLTCGAPVAKTKLINGGQKRVREPARYCAKHLAYYAARARAG